LFSPPFPPTINTNTQAAGVKRREILRVPAICIDSHRLASTRIDSRGRWPLAAGRWPLAAGRWPLAAGRWPLAAGRWPLAAGRWPRGQNPRPRWSI